MWLEQGRCKWFFSANRVVQMFQKIFRTLVSWNQGKSNEDKFGLTLTIALKFWKKTKTTSTKLCELESAYSAGMMCALGAWVLHWWNMIRYQICGSLNILAHGVFYIVTLHIGIKFSNWKMFVAVALSEIIFFSTFAVCFLPFWRFCENCFGCFVRAWFYSTVCDPS